MAGGWYSLFFASGCVGNAHYTSTRNRPLAPLPLTTAYRVHEAIFFQLLAGCKTVAAVAMLCNG